MFDDFFLTAHALTQRGEAFATATVVRAEKPTSGKPGDKAIITADGALIGWIGGSCAQPTVVKEALKALREDEARLIRLSPDPAAQTPRPGLLDVPMSCYSGGTLEIYIEPHHPRPRLLIVGNLPVAQALLHLGKAMNFETIVVDPEKSPTMSAADRLCTGLDELRAQVNALTFVVVATHGVYDEPAIEAALQANAQYVGLVASPKRGENVRAHLRESGLSDADLLAFKAPAGLDIHARRGDEIALSIMAEVVQRRRTAEALRIELFGAQTTGDAETLHTPTHATCPTCKGEVEIATAQNTTQHAGETYYFCCPHCKKRFEKDPARYLV
jgi:xanthine dehydrogenase accessory factor